MLRFWFNSYCSQTLTNIKSITTKHNCSWAGLDLLHMKTIIKWDEKDDIRMPGHNTEDWFPQARCEHCPLHKAFPKPSILCAYRLGTEARIKSAAPFSYMHTYTNGEPSKPHMKKAVSESQLIVQRPKTASQNPSAARCKRPVSSAAIQQLLWAEQSPRSHRRPSY